MTAPGMVWPWLFVNVAMGSPAAPGASPRGSSN